ncbi:hypothetical protein P7K49_026770 [Saguinus oedipus]|uniref:Galectin n=1 Tax=Saguinus oedipus TaxID=9490 RepID=A0ABQ9UE51_SAGOE|nr:hypothetical protein P7K49_026770 [Saguinus oedipus]
MPLSYSPSFSPIYKDDGNGVGNGGDYQVCQFVVSVNGLNVLHVDYRTVSNLILTGPRTIVMEVMEELEC